MINKAMLDMFKVAPETVVAHFRVILEMIGAYEEFCKETGQPPTIEGLKGMLGKFTDEMEAMKKNG